MSYVDIVRLPAQRKVAFVAAILALFWLAFCWLVTGIFGTTANPRLLTTLGTLITIVAGNAVLLFGGLKPTFHWLRIASIFSIGVMLAPVIIFILDPYGR